MKLFSSFVRITIRHKKNINHVKNQLTSNIVKTIFEPNYCDLFISEYPDKDKPTELDEHKVSDTVPVKNDEDREIKLEMIDEDENATDEKHDFENDYFLMIDVKSLTICKETQDPTNNEDADHLSVGVETNNIQKIHITKEVKRNDESKVDDKDVPTKSTLVKNRVNQEKADIKISSSNRSTKVHDKSEKPSTKHDEWDDQRNDIVDEHLLVERMNHTEDITIDKVESVTKGKKTNKLNTGSGYSCNICEFKCLKRDILNKHIKTHTGEKPYTCNLCKYKCIKRCELVYHMRTHTGEKPFSCNLCQHKSATSSNLSVHIMRNHTGVKPYSCDTCEYKCSDSQSLKVHMRTHTGEKPFSCNACQYKSTTHGHLLRHMRTHTGEKPYSCHLCEYKCTSSRYLKAHIKTHKEPYFCDLCEFSCVNSSNIAKHKRSHIGKNLRIKF